MGYDELIVNVSFKCPLRFKKLIDRRVEKTGLNISEYIRNAIMLESMLDGDVDSVKLFRDLLKNKVYGTVASLMKAV